jgi:hypothetical protein
MGTIKQVNERGIQYLTAWIIATTKTDEAGPACKTDAREIDAWCTEAEESMGAGNPPVVEMSEINTASGTPETFTIPVDGITEVEIDD